MLPRSFTPRRLGAAAVVLALGGFGLAAAVGSGEPSDSQPARATSVPAPRFSALAVETPLNVAAATGAPRLGKSGVVLSPAAERARQAAIRRNSRLPVPAATPEHFKPLYLEAQRAFGVNWLLIASIHRQETAFSQAEGTYHGRNFLGCCAGPMQFNLANGPVSTWELFRSAFRQARRPDSYPHETRRHPSIYDDFDAITAGAYLLQDSGARMALDGTAWQASYNYYGHDAFGVDYANQVVARAIQWTRGGFCANCAPDPALVASLEAAYGGYARAQLEAEARAERKRARAKRRKHRRALRRKRLAHERRVRRERLAQERHERAVRRAAERRREARERKREAQKKPAKPAPATTTTPTTPTTTTPTTTTTQTTTTPTTTSTTQAAPPDPLLP